MWYKSPEEEIKCVSRSAEALYLFGAHIDGGAQVTGALSQIERLPSGAKLALTARKSATFTSPLR